MSILITDSDWIDKIQQIEGKVWLHMQEHAQKRGDLSYTVFGAWKHWVGFERFSQDDRFSYVIYGDGGWNRYFIRNDGRVAFSRHHGYKHSLELAERVGFDIE